MTECPQGGCIKRVCPAVSASVCSTADLPRGKKREKIKNSCCPSKTLQRAISREHRDQIQ